MIPFIFSRSLQDTISFVWYCIPWVLGLMSKELKCLWLSDRKACSLIFTWICTKSALYKFTGWK